MKKILFASSLIMSLTIDQISKNGIETDSIILNQGISFGIFGGLMNTAVLCVVLVMCVGYFRKSFITAPVAIGIFLGASVSNILDRILYGGVRDFLPLPLLGIHNNLADWMIVLSLAWLFYDSHRPRLHNPL